jgi:hypothetical protein
VSPLSRASRGRGLFAFSPRRIRSLPCQSPEDRARAYWHPLHLRLCGRDFGDRLREAGFTVREDDFAYHLDPGETSRQGIVPETIYLSFR